MTVVFADSGLDISPEVLKKYDIEEIFMPFVLDGKEYTDKTQIELKDFYSALRAGQNVSTCSLNPQLYLEIFEPVLSEGKDIIYIHFSGKMSGTWNQLDVALKELREKFPERKIDVIDSLNISAGGGLLAVEVARRNKEGMPHNELVTWAKKNRNEYSTYFYVDDLKHLKKGGRISATTAFVGSVLSIKPIIHCASSGELKILGKSIGKKKAMQELVEFTKKNGKNILDHPIVILHADAENDAEEFKKMIEIALGPKAKIHVGIVGTTVGTHCGPGTVAIFFHGPQLIIK